MTAVILLSTCNVQTLFNLCSFLCDNYKKLSEPFGRRTENLSFKFRSHRQILSESEASDCLGILPSPVRSSGCAPCRGCWCLGDRSLARGLLPGKFWDFWGCWLRPHQLTRTWGESITEKKTCSQPGKQVFWETNHR